MLYVRHMKKIRARWMVGCWLLGFAWVASVSVAAADSHHKVHVAFGFHVNLYHSFRGDTLDENGFGKDIRIIRHILHTLDDLNARGIPVRAVWDFDNLFSLQERLPRYAPDILTRVKKRIREQGDEVILMSYNNGMASAMTRRELGDAVRWAVSNPWKSGVKDIFGVYSPIVRPQEMMTTPGVFSVYKDHGVEAMCLYYSATPFDAIRVFSRPLDVVEAHNPVTYRNPDTGESMVIIPTYNIGDLAENVSLGNWARRLNRMQQNGDIDRDLLIFINYDADSDFWVGADLRWPLKHLPNTRGLGAVVEEVRDLPYVVFTTLGDYLKNHPPVGTFHFGQDTADGSFVGYNSWSEKAPVTAWWTRIERARWVEKAARKKLSHLKGTATVPRVEALLNEAYHLRLRALSTTHFGLATPFVVPQRETAMEDLLNRLDWMEKRIWLELGTGIPESSVRRASNASPFSDDPEADAFFLIPSLCKKESRKNRFLNVELPSDAIAGSSYVLTDAYGHSYRAHRAAPLIAGKDAISRLKLFVPEGVDATDGIYRLKAQNASRPGQTGSCNRAATGGPARLKNRHMALQFDAIGRVTALFVDGVEKLEVGSLIPFVRYGDLRSAPRRLILEKMGDSGNAVQSVRLKGPWQGREMNAIREGQVDISFSLLEDLPLLMVSGHVTYPGTLSPDSLLAETPGSSRQVDLNWKEVAPLELRFTHGASRENPIEVLKENYLDVSSRYAIDYFKHSDENLSLDNVNHHITARYVGVTAGGSGIAVAMDPWVQANFAFAPLKVYHDALADRFRFRMNPFGTYHGRQYRPPTWGNGQGYDLTLIMGEQFHNAACTYNGQSLAFSVMLAFFDGRHLPEDARAVIREFSDAPTLVSMKRLRRPDPFPEDFSASTPLMADHRPPDPAEGVPAKGQNVKSIPLHLKLKVAWAQVCAFVGRIRL